MECKLATIEVKDTHQIMIDQIPPHLAFCTPGKTLRIKHETHHTVKCSMREVMWCTRESIKYQRAKIMLMLEPKH
ncbi:hypothetical protein Fmac_016075 [Flemingia macrophylla]|uniref:Uncharacterized protein n=1 Tax=Flemingia macrophylla TaxID=520843 RepID=A0ABD1MH22_9FABA